VSTPTFLNFLAETFSSNSYKPGQHPLHNASIKTYLVNLSKGETGRFRKTEKDPDNTKETEAGPEECGFRLFDSSQIEIRLSSDSHLPIPCGGVQHVRRDCADDDTGDAVELNNG